MSITSKNYPDWLEDLPDDNKAQPWGIYDQNPFVSVRQRDGGDSDTIHWVLIHKDEIEGFIEQVRNAANKAAPPLL